MKNLLKNKKLLAVFAAILVTLVTFLTLLFINRASKLNDLEQIAVSDFSSTFMLYADDVDVNKSDEGINIDLEKYVAFVLTYATNEEGKNELNKSEVIEYIKRFFDYEPSEEQLKELDITPYLKSRGINYSDETGELNFSIDRYNGDSRIIAATPFVSYVEVESRMKGKEITVTYDKYIIDNPHSVVGAISNAGNENMSAIKDYLNGRGSISALKKAARNIDLKTITEPSGQLTVTYVVKDGRIVAKPF